MGVFGVGTRYIDSMLDIYISRENATDAAAPYSSAEKAACERFLIIGGTPLSDKSRQNGTSVQDVKE